MRRLGAQRGQTTAEYLGLLVVVALIIAALGAADLKAHVVTAMQAAVCEMFPDRHCMVSDEQLARGDENAGAPTPAVPDPDVSAIGRTAMARDLGLPQSAGLDGASVTALARPASFELPPIPIPRGGTLIPDSDDPVVRELSGAENLQAAFDALLEGDVLGVAQGLFFGAPVGPGRAGNFGQRATELAREAGQRIKQATRRAWERLRDQRGEARLPVRGARGVSNRESNRIARAARKRGVPMVNARYAGKRHPETGVPFKASGFPDFTPYAREINGAKNIRVKRLTGNNRRDAAQANETVGFTRTPTGFTWNHVEDGKTMQLVPREIHENTRHTGGAALLRAGVVKPAE